MEVIVMPGRTLFLRILFLVLALSILAPVSRAHAPAKENILYTFQGGADGSLPVAGLIFDPAGNLYGTTASGGASNAGTVFELIRSGTRWNKTVLYSFTGGSDGGSPLAPLIFDGAGNLYGTASQGGAVSQYGSGVAFELSPNSGGWSETVLHNFTGYFTGDGGFPVAGMIFDSGGHLWGTAAGNSYTAGMAFDLTLSNGSWTETLVNLGTSTNPLAGLVFDNSGHLYGTTEFGYNPSYGSVYQLTYSQKGWSVNTLYTFTGGSDGSRPAYGKLIFDNAGNLYGTTQFGGSYGYGVVFKVSGSPGHPETVLYNFTGGSDGAYPLSGLILDSPGNLYGTTEQGGTLGYGTVFKLARGSGGQWNQSVLHSFAGGMDGAYPVAGVVQDGRGRLCGTTQYGGAQNAGVVYTIQP
jgi:uncharacterized repeat protein (TIGR03803 family)